MVEQLKQDRIAQVLLAVTAVVGCVGFFLVGGVLILAVGGNNTDESPVVAQSPPTEPPVPTQTATQVVEATATVTPTPEPPTPEPTTPPPPTLPPPSDYQEPFVLLEYSAVGEDVSDNFSLPPCQKAVFNYSVQASNTGLASLILKLNKIGENRNISLVSEIEETPQMVGQVLQPLTGGEYYFSSENTDESWSIVLECQDNAAPVTEGIDIQGDGPTVSLNYRLPACQKSVFVWETHPSDSGLASIIAYVYLTEGDLLLDRAQIAGEVDEGVITGETLQSVSNGVYFVTVENTTEPWRIRWECRE